MKTRAILTLFISLGLAGLAAFLANDWITERLGAAEAETAMGHVVIATEDYAVGTKLEAPHVKLFPMDQDAIPPGSLTSLDQAIGRVVTQPLYAGEILIEKRLNQHEGGSPLAVVIEKGKRALTVRVNDVIGVAGFLLPSNRVDVVSTQRRVGNRKAETKTIVENLKVLAVDQTVSSDKNDPVIVRAVTLEVTPKEAEQIVKATEEGSVQLTLRNPLDVEKSAQPQVAKVTSPKQAPRPRLVRSDYRVDVIRGTEKSKILVTN